MKWRLSNPAIYFKTVTTSTHFMPAHCLYCRPNYSIIQVNEVYSGVEESRPMCIMASGDKATVFGNSSNLTFSVCLVNPVLLFVAGCSQFHALVDIINKINMYS